MIRPLLNYVLIRADESEQVTAGGIHLPQIRNKDEFASTPYQYGTIVAVGEGSISDDNVVISTRLQVNRRVIFKAHDGQEIPSGPDKGMFLVPSGQVAGYVE